MRNVIIMLLVAFVLAGCPTHVVRSDERSVLVESQKRNEGDAQKLADAECAKNGGLAKMTSKAGYWDRNYEFECIPSNLPINKASVVETANKTAPQQASSSKVEVINTTNKTTPQRFRDLQTLKNEGLITDEEYQQKKKQLLENL